MSASYKREVNETLILRQRYLESTKTKKSKKNNSNNSSSATSGGGGNNKMAGNNNGGAATAERRPSANNSGNYNFSIWRVNRSHQFDDTQNVMVVPS